MSVIKLKEMFAEMVIPKKASLIPHYYHSDFLLYTNGEVMDYATFLTLHQKYYATDIQYQVKYDDKTWVEENNKIAGRVFITTASGNNPAREIEVILIAEYKEGKIFRLWELTYPDWSKLPAFQE